METRRSIKPTYQDIQKMIQDAAYFKWVEAGSPAGKDQEFWDQAERELFGDCQDGYKVFYREDGEKDWHLIKVCA